MILPCAGHKVNFAYVMDTAQTSTIFCFKTFLSERLANVTGSVEQKI
jgi:hypothetical protein